MRAREVNINQFNTIEEVYTFIDTNAYNLKHIEWDLRDLWMCYRNKAKSKKEKTKAQWEMSCFMFDVKGEKLFPQVFAKAKDTSEMLSYPALEDFKKNVVTYFKKRADKSSNSLIKAQYNHVLWKCPVDIKHNSFAISAIKAYIQTIEDYCEIIRQDAHKLHNSPIDRLFESLIALSSEIKVDRTPVKKLTNKLLFSSIGLEFYMKHVFLTHMLKYPKIFKPDDFENTLSIFEEEIKRDKEVEDNFLLAEFYLPTALTIAAKIKSDITKWHNEIGLAYLKLAEAENKEDRLWIKQKHCVSAIKAFSSSGNKEKKLQVETLYAKVKKKVTLPTIQVSPTKKVQAKLLRFQNNIKKKAKRILEQPPEEIYRIISKELIFPQYATVLKGSEDKENSFFDSVVTSYFDDNNNIYYLSRQEEEERKIYELYGYYLKLGALPYLFHILVPGIKSGNLTPENFIDFIKHHTWIGTPFLKHTLGGDDKPTYWIDVLNPAITEFFLQVQAWVSTSYYRPSFVLCIDSLTLKFEGLMRDFCSRMNIPTSVSRTKGMQEIYAHNVLENEIIKKHFNENDLLLFNYLFTTQNGLNLRNKIAHSLYDYDDYNLDHMLLLIATLLRLGKYNYVSKSTEGE